ncbi:hypothetical protein JKG68_16075 [Microvirga aerilata]|uniref:Uncharacterized protein n=1 Tax=Microvirga aerilata TaxID=670292 RepID=A0A936Z9M3_9HYPH|nr:hypothetical protein [Microvirga aerilata]MBL0405487.1 hypothetical protein [Microvirga aerilata]
MNRPGRFRQADVARAVRGATAAGMKVSRVEIEADGRIVLVSGDPARRDSDTADSALDTWRAKRDARTT